MQLFCFFSVSWQGLAYLGLQVKAITPHLALFTSISHRLFIILSPQKFSAKFDYVVLIMGDYMKGR
jgi:hypothetical protein